MADVYDCGGNNLVGVYGGGGSSWWVYKAMAEVDGGCIWQGVYGSGGSIWWVYMAVVCVWCEWAAAA